LSTVASGLVFSSCCLLCLPPVTTQRELYECSVHFCPNKIFFIAAYIIY
jgi:hypothetical protein